METGRISKIGKNKGDRENKGESEDKGDRENKGDGEIKGDGNNCRGDREIATIVRE